MAYLCDKMVYWWLKINKHVICINIDISRKANTSSKNRLWDDTDHLLLFIAQKIKLVYQACKNNDHRIHDSAYPLGKKKMKKGIEEIITPSV